MECKFQGGRVFTLMYPQCLAHSRCPINICWINQWVFFNRISRINRIFKISKQRKTFYKKLKILLPRTWAFLTLEAHIFITSGFCYRIIFITVITRAYFTENLWIHFLKFLKTPLCHWCWGKIIPSVCFLVKKLLLNHTNPSSCLNCSFLFCLIYSLAKDILYYTFLLNNRIILKNLHTGNQTILQTVMQIPMIRWVSRIQEHLKDHLPHLFLRCSMAVYSKCHLAL